MSGSLGIDSMVDPTVQLPSIRTTTGRGFGRPAILLARYALLALLAVLFVAPLVWLFISSVRPIQEIFRYVTPLSWRSFWPESFTLDGYLQLMSSSFPHAMLNSAILATATVVAGVAVNALAAYAFARLHLPARDVLF